MGKAISEAGGSCAVGKPGSRAPGTPGPLSRPMRRWPAVPPSNCPKHAYSKHPRAIGFLAPNASTAGPIVVFMSTPSVI